MISTALTIPELGTLPHRYQIPTCIHSRTHAPDNITFHVFNHIIGFRVKAFLLFQGQIGL